MAGRIVLVLVALTVLTGTVQAQSLTEGEIAVIPPKSVLLRNRLELMPRFGLTINDPLIRQFPIGVTASFYINEAFLVDANFEWYDLGDLGGPTDAYYELIENSSSIPELAPVTWFASADFGWIPVNGKFSLFDKWIVYHDFYALIGLGAIETVGDIHFAGTFGLGERIFLTRWLSFVLEFRDRMYVEPLPSGNSFTNIFTFTFGFGFFLPPSFDYTLQEERILDWE